MDSNPQVSGGGNGPICTINQIHTEIVIEYMCGYSHYKPSAYNCLALLIAPSNQRRILNNKMFQACLAQPYLCSQSLPPSLPNCSQTHKDNKELHLRGLRSGRPTNIVHTNEMGSLRNHELHLITDVESLPLGEHLVPFNSQIFLSFPCSLQGLLLSARIPLTMCSTFCS